jgi:hypothetical protein
MKKTLVLACSLLSLFFVSCDEYDEAGSDGKLPENWQQEEEISVSVYYPVQPDPIPCNSFATFVEAVARERIDNCEGYNFRALYERAKQEAENRISQVTCNNACPNKRIWVHGRKAVCIPGEDGERSEAFVKLVLALGCFTEGQEPGGVLPEPADADFTDPVTFNRPDPYPDDGFAERYDNLPAGERLACGTIKCYQLTQVTRVPACPANFEGYVDSAVAQANRIYDRFTCAEGCRKVNFRVFRKTWACKQVNDGALQLAEVHVEVFFQVECKQ